jgi:hypothetical protein
MAIAPQRPRRVPLDGARSVRRGRGDLAGWPRHAHLGGCGSPLARRSAQDQSKEDSMNRTILGVAALAACAAGCLGSSYSQTLNIDFSPMYSGYDGMHTYQVPATISNAAVTGIANVSWSASDPSVVNLAPASDGIGVLITTKKAGQVTITATTGNAVGKSLLTVAAYTPQQWAAGQARYMSGAAGAPSCLSCHDPAAAAAMASDSGRTVEHTPQQTGGFNDVQLRRVFMNGELPDSDANPLHISPTRFAGFHTWQASDVEADGLVVFLRSLTPKSQGDLDFGGHGGGGGHHDGGMGGPPHD